MTTSISAVTPKPLPDNMRPTGPDTWLNGPIAGTNVFERGTGPQRPNMRLYVGPLTGNVSFGTLAARPPEPYMRSGMKTFDEAVRAAATISSANSLDNGNLRGTQPIGVLSAREGAFVIAALRPDPAPVRSGSFVLFADRESLKQRNLTQTFSKYHVDLKAIVSANQFVDLRDVKPEESATPA